MAAKKTSSVESVENAVDNATSRKRATTATASSPPFALADKKSTTKSATKKATSKATASKAAAKKATASKAAAKKATSKTSASKTAATKSTAKQAAKPAATKTATSKTSASKTAATKSTAKQAAKPAATKPAATKTTTKQTTASKASRAKNGFGRLAVKEGERPWTAAEIAEVRATLDFDADRLRGEITTAEQEIGQLLRQGGEGAGNDQADVGSNTFERDHEMSMVRNARENLELVEEAVKRIEAGTYGICESCGQPIGKMRLRAFPRATLCMECKQRQERR